MVQYLIHCWNNVMVYIVSCIAATRTASTLSLFPQIYCTPDRFSPFRYTGCPRRNVQHFGRVFLMLNCTDITQNTYIRSLTVIQIIGQRKVWSSCDSRHCNWLADVFYRLSLRLHAVSRVETALWKVVVLRSQLLSTQLANRVQCKVLGLLSTITTRVRMFM
jgi:hypothetical protein